MSAGALAVSLPNGLVPYGNPAVGLIALVPMYLAFRSAPSMRNAVAAGAVFGFASTALSGYWLGNFGDFAVFTLGGPIAGYTAYNMLLATVLYTLMRLPAHIRPLAFSAAWTGYELLKSTGYLAFPWGLAAHSFGGVVPLLQIADITGVYGLSFLVVYANSSFAELAVSRAARPGLQIGPSPRAPTARATGALSQSVPVGATGPAQRILATPATRHLVMAAVLFAVAGVYGYSRLALEPTSNDSIRAVLVQQNTDSWQPGGLEESLSVLQRLSQEGLAEGEHDLLVWSESSLTRPYIEERTGFFARHPADQPFTDFISELDVPLLTGSPYLPSHVPDAAWNAVLHIEPGSGEVLDRYGKRHLVPFAEHIPFWEVPLMQRFFRDVVGLQRVWAMADERVLFEVPTREGTAQAATPISFEGSFAYLGRDFTRGGADVLINLTNNSWSQSDTAQYQQFVVTRFRAIEARRPVMLATISGLTSTIDIFGRTTASIPMFEEGYLSTRVSLYDDDSLTVYHIVGDLFAWLMIGATGWLVIRVAYEQSSREALGPSPGKS
ncbi:MAG: apolipoprotein N-acyltransferase [Spirochaetales bacterium]